MTETMDEISQELMDKLIDAFGEEQALDMSEHAQANREDPIEYLEDAIRRKLNIEEPEPEPVELELPKIPDSFGWSVVPCIYDRNVYDDEQDEWKEERVDRGWCLCFRGANMTVFCGRSMSEFNTVNQVADPWQKKVDAETACTRKAEILERAPVRNLRRIRISLTTTVPQLGNRPKKLQKQLTQRQQDALSTLTEAYRHSGRHDVQSENDTIVLILDAIADQLRLKRD